MNWPMRSRRQMEPAQADAFAKLDADLYFANQLFRSGSRAQMLQGVTQPSERKERIRLEILHRQIEDHQTLDDRSHPTGETFAQAFERLYGESVKAP